MPYIFAFWFATNIFEGINRSSIAGVPIHALSQVQALLTLGLLGIQIAWFQDYTKREFWCIAGVTLVFAVSMLTSGIRYLFSAWLFIVAAQKTDFEQLVRIAFRILLACLLVIALFYLADLIPDPHYYRGDKLRYSFGFTHPNSFGMHLFHLSACWCYLRRDRFRWWDILLMLALAAFAYFGPNSQTATLGILLALLIMLCVRYRVNVPVVWVAALTACLPVVSVLLSSMDLQGYPLLRAIDGLLSNRFSGAHNVWLRYGATLLGNKIYVLPEERALIGLEQSLWLDNAYSYILLRYGAVSLCVFSAGYIYTICWHGKRRHNGLVYLLFLYAIYGVEENYLQMLGFNVFLLATAQALYGQRADPKVSPAIYFSLPILVGKIRDHVKKG